MSVERVIAWLGSFVGNTTMFGAIVAGWPGVPPGFPSFVPGDGLVVIEVGRFRPYIVDTGNDSWATRHRPRCPGSPAMDGLFGLAEAPLPLAFDPTARPSDKVYACVQVSGEGKVGGVSFVGVADPYVKGALTAMIRHRWCFYAIAAGGEEPGWIRVRLNDGPPEPPAIPLIAVD